MHQALVSDTLSERCIHGGSTRRYKELKGIRYKGMIIRKKDMKVCVVYIHIRDEGDDPDPRVACRPPHRQHGLLHLSCIDDDAPNLIYFIALRYGKLALHFVLKEVISFLDFGKVECF